MVLPNVVRAGLQSGSIMMGADVATQTLIEQHDDWDWKRTARFGSAGLFLHGPYFYKGFQLIDRFFGGKTASPNLSVVLYKTASAQFLLFPPFLVGLFAFLGVLEGSPDVYQKVVHRVPQAFVNGCLYWPVANGLNFALVSPHWRVPYLAASSGFWNAYLSWFNNASD